MNNAFDEPFISLELPITVSHFYVCFVMFNLRVSSHAQAGRRVLATDEWLRVRGCDGVYALGDCASITQRKVMVCSV